MADIVEEVRKGRPEGLRALRDELASAIAAAEPKEVAALARQLSDVLGQLDALKEPEESTLDDLASRRASRGAPVSDPATVPKQRRARGGGASS